LTALGGESASASKSCENVYRGNTFRNSEGCLTLRHGNRCVIDGNYFLGGGAGSGKGAGGVRVIGEDHVITNNYFEGTTGIAGGVIVLTAGQPKPELTGYWPITKATITGNTFINNVAPACINLSAGLGQKDRELLKTNLGHAGDFVLINYDRKVLRQAGAGHISPIGAYDEARDLVLMLDVYKKDYEPVWAPLPRLAKAMATLSRKTGEPRGYAVVKRRK